MVLSNNLGAYIDDLNFANNEEQGVPNPGHARQCNEAINIPYATNVHENIGGPCVGRVHEASTIGAIPTSIERTEAYYRIQNLKILHQCKKYKDSLIEYQSSLKVTIDALKAALQKNETIPDYLAIIKIKAKLPGIINKVLFGAYDFSTMFPSIDMMMEAVLMSFEIDEDVEARASFTKIWNEPRRSAKNIRSIVIRTFSNGRSNFGGIAKTELFRLLGIPVLLSNATLEEISSRGAKMEELKAGDTWRVKVNSNGSRDLFGSKAIHGAIAKAIYGEAYDIEAPVEITLEKAGWLFHILLLAMAGCNLEAKKTMEDRRMMARWKCVALEEVNYMKQIHIINPLAATMADVACHS